MAPIPASTDAGSARCAQGFRQASALGHTFVRNSYTSKLDYIWYRGSLVSRLQPNLQLPAASIHPHGSTWLILRSRIQHHTAFQHFRIQKSPLKRPHLPSPTLPCLPTTMTIHNQHTLLSFLQRHNLLLSETTSCESKGSSSSGVSTFACFRVQYCDTRLLSADLGLAFLDMLRQVYITTSVPSFYA